MITLRVVLEPLLMGGNLKPAYFLMLVEDQLPFAGVNTP
jgi:hypothetical protein